MLRREKSNNGYWCGCCKETHESCDWVDDITPKDFIDEIYEEMERKNDTFEGVSYESEDLGVVFMCDVHGGKTWEQWFLVKPNEDKLLIYNWAKAKSISKQQDLFPEKMPTKEESLKWLTSD